MRFTKIICTLGPATNTHEKVEELIKCGMNVARINLSHGTLDQHRETIHMLKDINAKLQKSSSMPRSVAILLDTKGAEIRTGDVHERISIVKGEEVIFSPHPLTQEDKKVIQVNHEHFSRDVIGARHILLDNGELTFDLVTVQDDGSVVARARENGSIGSRRHVNLPGANVSIPSVTDKDWTDLAFGVEQDVDFVALSFIRIAKEVEEVRAFLKKKKSRMKIISKIETEQAVTNIEGIIDASDGIMVARGDLGAELPFEKLPAIQDDIIDACKRKGKPVIVATHMLESMILRPMPTRAEVTDIAHAATTRTDATMLSGETASGEHPVKALEAMRRVLVETEAHIALTSKMEDQVINSEREARAKAAVTLAVSTQAKALVVMTRTGNTARDVAKFRPTMPIIAFADNEHVQHELQLSYGVLPVFVPFSTDPEQSVVTALAEAKKLNLLHAGERIILVSDTKVSDTMINTIQLRTIA